MTNCIYCGNIPPNHKYSCRMYLTGKIDRSETVIITDDFLRTKDVFEVDNEFYVCTEIINEEKKLFGVLVSTFDTFPKQKEFHFHEVIERYFKK